MNQSSQAEE